MFDQKDAVEPRSPPDLNSTLCEFQHLSEGGFVTSFVRNARLRRVASGPKPQLSPLSICRAASESSHRPPSKPRP